MFVAAWSFDVQYGTREEAMRILKDVRGVVESAGWRAKRSRILSGSIGAPESRFVIEHEFDSLADLEASWQALHGRAADFNKLVSQLKTVIVSGSPRWEIFRIIDG